MRIFLQETNMPRSPSNRSYSFFFNHTYESIKTNIINKYTIYAIIKIKRRKKQERDIHIRKKKKKKHVVKYLLLIVIFFERIHFEIIY